MTSEPDELACLQGKTPISYLQELCTKRGVTPQFDLVANEGAVHEPLFVFKVVAGEYVGNGRGPSKKKAKHNAAIDVLTQMTGIPIPATPPEKVSVDGQLRPLSGRVEDSTSGNPVGELQEITQKKMWPPPVYDFTDEQGPPHAREFICTVRLFNLTERAGGKSKKLAKRNAAQAMLQVVRMGIVAPQVDVEPNEEYEEETIPLPQPAYPRSVPQQLTSHGDVARTVRPTESSKMSAMFQTTGKTRLGRVLESLHNVCLDDIDCCQRLLDLSREQKFEIVYMDLPNLSHSGKRQCVVRLSSNPVTVCPGSGDTVESAHASAALNTLHHIRVMSKKITTI